MTTESLALRPGEAMVLARAAAAALGGRTAVPVSVMAIDESGTDWSLAWSGGPTVYTMRRVMADVWAGLELPWPVGSVRLVRGRPAAAEVSALLVAISRGAERVRLDASD